MDERKLKILIIDDDADNLAAFKNNVSKALPGTEVLTSLNGLQGIELAKTHEPDVILIDVSISKIDGLKISHLIKKDKNLQTTPMLFITDLEGDLEFKKNVLKAGADAFLVKPIDDMLLITQLKVMAKIKERNILISTQKDRLETLVEERTKELRAFYKLSELSETKDISQDELLQDFINLFPSCMQYPDITYAKIKLGDMNFQTKNFTESIWKLSNPININGLEAGIIEVGYLEERQESDEGPFMKEERHLLNAIAERLGHIIERFQSKINTIESQAIIKESENRLDMFFQQSFTGFFIMLQDEPIEWNDSVDKEKALDYIFEHQKLTKINTAMLKQYAYSKEEMVGKSLNDMFSYDLEYWRTVLRQVFDEGNKHSETYQKRSDGTEMWIEGDFICLYDSLGRIIGHFGNQQDVTLRIQRQQEIEYLSNHDYLTDLYNRRYYFEQFKQLNHPSCYPLGIMMIDVNGLKIVNDAFGHAIGDIALKTLGNVLKDTFKQNDVVSRIGGDEFAVLLPNTTHKKLQRYKDQLKESVKQHRIENIELSLAIGYELKQNQNHDKDVDDILELAENHMYRHKSIEGASVRNRAINAILQTLTDKYEVERNHSVEVSHFCKLIGQQLKLREDEIKGLEQAGMFHDIGKISIPDSILNKPGKLTNQEYDVIKTHTEVGYQILRAADEYSDLAVHALHHHERWDGKGYPSGMKGNDIPLFSRIIGVVDAYEAMTADRPYRKKMSEEYAIQEIKKYSGTQFDPKIAKIFIEKVLTKQDIK
ncbi:MAG: diguanylate cyclase [Tenericutes bacterium]|jgi:diguanylate cyclase (GGDEF)-like protein/PAS domain S-box-containing protein|nr:diguanylate cyclase [Mycoplasmatota bacterium]